MAFVDPLAVMLLVAGLSTLLLAIYAFMFARGKKGLANLAVPMFVLGMFNFISGFFLSFAWPMPGAYNMLFGDAQLVLGLLMLMGGYMLYKNIDIKILTIFGFFFGIYLAMQAVAIPAFGLESGANFLPAFGLYVFAALSGIFSPLVYTSSKSGLKYAYYFLFALLIITTFLLLFIGYTAIYEHLGSPP
ncbi:DUF981 family protein [Candidatus Marsarchaeota archaeon]|jgi:putative membrane protein|nr:DUF981 family protein [Candidatus Marsarchaeota archaeon]MCL5100289.1 DUF981 family protein [Candidatus Marsarchaeota archaeon]